MIVVNLKLVKKLLLLCVVIILLSLFVMITTVPKVTSVRVLKQVVILSRHGVRTPLGTNLAEITPKSWPKWKEKSGHLTKKGAILEGYMGHYFSEWLIEQKLFPVGCPSKEDVLVYANVKERTIASAQAFVDNAFKNCNITVHHNDSAETDPIFNPVIHNSTESFKKMALHEMQLILDTLALNISYEDLSSILDYKNSAKCKKEKECNFTTDENTIIDVEVGLKPKMKGPLKICNEAIDAFVMEYYEGIDNVAWGMLKDIKEWNTIMDLSRGYHNVIFNTSIIAQDISEPMLNYMTKIFVANSYKPKFVLLMGHDANILTILNGMKFKPYNLQNQHEHSPVGGKILFERWSDERLGKDFLKLHFVYQSNTQLRNGVKLSLESPPQFTVLELENCKMDENGFCPWEDFVKLLHNL